MTSIYFIRDFIKLPHNSMDKDNGQIDFKYLDIQFKYLIFTCT